MKKLLFTCLGIATMSLFFSSCEKELEAPDSVENTHKVSFSIVGTKTVISDEDSGTFAWESADMDNFHIYENEVAPTTISAVLNEGKATVVAEYPNADGPYTYKGFWGKTLTNSLPSVAASQINVDGVFDPASDILIAKPIENQDERTISSTGLQLQFRRVVAINKMTLKNLPANAEISKVVITSDQNFTGYYNYSTSEWTLNGSSITVDLMDSTNGDPLSVSNSGTFDLYFVSGPVTNATFTVTATIGAGKTYSKTFTKTISFEENSINRFGVNLTGCEQTLFYEGFAGAAGTGGNTGGWSGSIASATFTDGTSSDNSGWTLVKGYSADDCIKLGTGSDKGSATTPALGISSGSATISFKAGAWSGDATGLNISVVGDGVLDQESVTLANEAWTTYTVRIANATAETKLKFEAAQASGNRFFLDEIAVTKGCEAFDYLAVSKDEETLDYNVTSTTFDISTAGSWTATIDDVNYPNATVTPSSGTGDATVTVSFPENSLHEIVTAAVVTVTVNALNETVTIKQTAAPGMATKTIQEFISAADTETNYQLTGTVTSSIENKSFTLTDNTGSIYVYQLNDVSSFVEGDIVTLYGKYKLYNSTHEVGSGQYVSSVTTPKLSVDKTSIIVEASATSSTFNITASDGTAWTVSSDNADLSFTPSSGTGSTSVTVSFSANTASTDKTATITVASSTENVYKSPREISFTQGGVVTGKPTNVTLDFTAQNYTNEQNITSLSVTPITATMDNPSGNAPAYYTSDNTMRLYNGNTMTISSVSGKPITKIVINANTNAFTANCGTLSSDTWTGQASSVVFSFSGTTRITSIVVTYIDPNAVIENPTLTISDDFQLAVGKTKTLTVTTNSDGAITYSSSNTDIATVSDAGVVTAVAAGNATITVSVAATTWYYAAEETVDVTVTANTGTEAIINFGSATGSTKVNDSPVSGDDSAGNEWTITSTGDPYYGQNTSYSQIGSSGDPANSITFTTTLPAEKTITEFSAKFGGFKGTAGTITLKVGDTTVGTGSLNASTDVTVESTSSASGTVLTVTVTGISKGVKAYFISYTYN